MYRKGGARAKRNRNDRNDAGGRTALRSVLSWSSAASLPHAAQKARRSCRDAGKAPPGFFGAGFRSGGEPVVLGLLDQRDRLPPARLHVRERMGAAREWGAHKLMHGSSRKVHSVTGDICGRIGIGI
jgi:hypothetical protein